MIGNTINHQIIQVDCLSADLYTILQDIKGPVLEEAEVMRLFKLKFAIDIRLDTIIPNEEEKARIYICEPINQAI